MKHPNAAAGLVSGAGLGTLIVWLLNRYAHTGLGPEEATAIAGGVAALVLFVGRRGIVGALRAIWRGTT